MELEVVIVMEINYTGGKNISTLRYRIEIKKGLLAVEGRKAVT